jgi:hypothetical protein
MLDTRCSILVERRASGIILVFAFLVPLCVTVPGCAPTVEREAGEVHAVTSTQIEPSASEGPPPLVVDTGAPLLLEELSGGQEAAPPGDSGAAAANAACFVCHANYRAEFLVDRHATAGVGCTNCHGESLAHKNDENNTTPPEIMYPGQKIDPFCQGCHAAHDVSPGRVVVRWMERGLDKIDPGKIVCTDCHGEHRMKVRTVVWDKSSGELLRTNKGQ